MNKQSENGIEWTDYTWNPVGGCQHACRWQMPDGSTAICYAEGQVQRMQSDRFYARGFSEHYWNPERLAEPKRVKAPAKIFLDSMSDLMGHWVPREQIEQVLAVCRETPQHQYQLLTKNAPRLLQFEFPDNVWVGVSAPPSEMMGKRLSVQQQSAMVRRQWEVMARVKAKIRWMSIEPLSFDIVGDFYGTGLSHKPPFEWFVIGAASNGRTIYQPHPAWVGGVVGYADLLHIPVFFKGNLRGNAAVATLGWRNAFPEVKDG